MENLKHHIEAALLRILFTAFRALPLDTASFAGGFMARSIGPFLSAHKTAAKNLSMVFPHWPTEKKRRILTEMWDNLGRTAAEMPHMPGKELYRRITIDGTAPSPSRENPVVFFSGHLGNWELNYLVAHQRGIPVALVYRRANNPQVEQIVAGIRASQSSAMFAKGPHSAIKIVRAVKDGYSLAMLIDQKMNDGIAVPFFGREAMTAPAIAEFALRYGLPLIPACVVRVSGCRFKLTVYPPLAYEKTGDDVKDVLAIMTKINRQLEEWICEHPAQWFWVHKRWPDTQK